MTLLEQQPTLQAFSPAVEDFILRFQLQQPRLPAPQLRGTRHAAVLIPIICREEPTILLTRRSDSLRKHPGQVAFPGGAADARYTLLAPASRAICTISLEVVPRTMESSTSSTLRPLNSLPIALSFWRTDFLRAP